MLSVCTRSANPHAGSCYKHNTINLPQRGTLKFPDAQRVDRKIRAVFVSGAGNTGQIGMLIASTQSPNYVDLHKGSNYS
jgi:hypothetical protein